MAEGKRERAGAGAEVRHERVQPASHPYLKGDEQMTDESVEEILEIHDVEATDEERCERLAAKLRAADEIYDGMVAEEEDEADVLYRRMVAMFAIQQKYDTALIGEPRLTPGFCVGGGTRTVWYEIMGSSPEEIAVARRKNRPAFAAVHRFLTRDLHSAHRNRLPQNRDTEHSSDPALAVESGKRAIMLD